MKRLLFASASLLAFAATTASAADIPVYRPRPPLPPIWSWTGCYIGGHVGGLWARKDWSDRQPGSLTFGLSDGGHDADGFLGGAQIGCDYQFAGWVIGIAGDYAWTDADGSSVSVLFPPYINHSRVKSLASVTGRVGFAWDRFLGYVKGGGAWEHDEYDYSIAGVVTGSVSETRSGWTVGIGGEYAFTNYLSGFIEYNYYDFAGRDLTFSGSDGLFIQGIDETKSVVKAGINFRFSAWGAGRY
jgi:outer membrane immunogenic protein